MKYASLENIEKRLLGRLSFSSSDDVGLGGVSGTIVDTELVEMIIESTEDFVDLYLGMIYVLPLKNRHPYLNAIVEKMVVAEIYTTYFPTIGEGSTNTDSFASTLRLNALNEFQSLFNGLGIFIPGSNLETNSLQNDENRSQMVNKAIILPGEELKKYIGYDVDGDNIVDSDLFKMNTNTSPSFYTTGLFDHIGENESVINGVRVKPLTGFFKNNVDIDFW